MTRPDLERRLVGLARRLEEAPRGGAEAALEASAELGALLRRRSALQREALEAELAALEEKARQRLTPELLAQALGTLDLEELARAERRDPGELDAERALAATFLEGRERAEAVSLAARALGAGAAPLGELRRQLAGLDRLAQARLPRLLLLNPERRRLAAELDAEAAADWWWSLRAGCRLDLLASPGVLTDDEQTWLDDHLRSCEACHEELLWQARLSRLLGGTPEGHPAAPDLTAHAAGELPAAERESIASHLERCASCRALSGAARAGLEEAERIERGLSLLAAGQAAPPIPTAPLHLPLALPRAPAARALAATSQSGAPEPADRRVLLEEVGLYRLIYFRAGAAGRLGLFVEPPGELSLELALDGVPIQPMLREPEVLLFDLGPTAELAGRTLRLMLRQGGALLLERSFTLIEEAP